MPGIVRRSSSVESGDSGPDLSRANKRPRLTDDGNESLDDSWILDPPGTARTAEHGRRIATPGRPRTSASARAMPRFKPGQLVRISMQNFLTYTSATYHPGPTLNMIIGPNGTGKSSVVCAICIGLDFPPALLGRSKELHEFVRHGCEEASVELEIKGLEGRVNQVVRLVFTKEGGKKSFYLNDRACRAKDIHDVRRSFGIQVDNLCHFLPQDRVVEFSRLTPKERLRETLRGAAPAHMTEKFEELKSWAAEHRAAIQTRGDKGKTLANLEERQNQQQGDVDRMRQREELVKEVKYLQLARPIARAAKAHTDMKEAVQRRNVLRAEHEELERQLQPRLHAIKEKAHYAKQVKQVRNTRKTLCDNFQKQVENYRRKDRDQESRYKGFSTKKEAIAKDERDLKNEIARAQQKIQNYETQSQQELVDFDPAEYNARIREKQRQIISIQDSMDETRDSGTTSAQDIEEKKHLIRGAQRRIEGFQTQAGRQMEVLERSSPETAIAWKWIQENRSRLRSNVYGPPILECTLTEERFAPMIESLFNRNDLLRIVVTSFDDLELLTEELQRKKGLSDINLINQRSGLDRFRAPLEADKTRRLGVHGWALDLIKGPEPVLAALCDVAKIHATAVSWEDVSDQRFQELQHSGLSSLLTSRSSYRITRRKEYGPEATSTMVKGVPDTAQWWTSRPVDPTVEAGLREDIDRWESEIQQMEFESGNVRERVNRLRDESRQIESEVEDLEQEKDDKVRHNTVLQGLPIKISNEKSKVEGFQEKLAGLKNELDTLKTERRDVCLARAQNSINLATALENLRTAWTNYIMASITLIEAESDVAALQDTQSDAQSQLQQKVEQLDSIKEMSRSAKAEFALAKHEWFQNVESNPELQEYFQSLPQEIQDRHPDGRETDIQAAQARLELLQGGDPRTITEFNARARKIEALQQEVATASRDAEELEKQIEGVRPRWESELEGLVSKISEAFAASFDKINCLGSVEVGKSADSTTDEGGIQGAAATRDLNDEGSRQTQGFDFENWTIEIRVSFREGEPMSVLDSHRQSGGERAVTTIYYLMALQALSQAPFRVVDEINQGMDPRNERIVHERMVDIACNGGARTETEDGGSQYFLITPKLLQGLKYDWRMKVHIVVSGEFMPRAEPGAQPMTFAKLVERMRSMRSGGDDAWTHGTGAQPTPQLVASGH